MKSVVLTTLENRAELFGFVFHRAQLIFIFFLELFGCILRSIYYVYFSHPDYELNLLVVE